MAKNKVAPPFRTAEIDLFYARGLAKSGELVDLGVKFGLILKSGAWYQDTHPGPPHPLRYTMPDPAKPSEPIKLGQGRDKARLYLEANPELAVGLETAIRAAAAHSEKLLAQPGAGGSTVDVLEEVD